MSNLNLLHANVALIQQWLDRFEPGLRPRRAIVGRTGEYVIVQACPLPDGYRPDEVDVMLLVDRFPVTPPIGLYVLNNVSTAATVAQLRGKFRAFENNAYHDAPAIQNYVWVCAHYPDNRWAFCAADVRRGDHLGKFLQAFYFEAGKP